MGYLKIKPTQQGLLVRIGFSQHVISWEDVDSAVERMLPSQWRGVAGLALRTLEGHFYPPAGAPGVPDQSANQVDAFFKAGEPEHTTPATRPAGGA